MSGHGIDSIGSKVARGAKWMVVLRLAERLVGLASFAVLARVLLPSDFGLMVLATSAIAFIELFGQAGLDLALIQRRDAKREEYDTAWTINILLGVAIAIVAAVAARPLAGLMHEARLEHILYWLAAASVLGGFQNVGIVDFQKFFAFDKEFRFRLATRMLKVGATIGFALAWRDYWALVAGYLAGTAILVLLSYVLHPYRPRFSLRAMHSFTQFSGWVLVRNIVGGVNDHLVNFIVARQASVSSLAFLSAGREFAQLATSEIQAPIRRALFPGFAAMSREPDALRRSYLEWTAIMALLTFPIPAGVAMVAPDAVLVLMGDQWLAAVPLIRILTCAGIFRSSASGAQQLFIAIGKPKLAATLAVVRAVLLIPLVVIGTLFADAAGAAWAILATSAAMCAVNLSLVASVLQLRAGSLLHVTYRPILATVVMVAAVWAVDSVLPPRSDFVSASFCLIAAALVGVVAYVVSLLALWSLAGRPHGAEWSALKILKVSTAPGVAG